MQCHASTAQFPGVAYSHAVYRRWDGHSLDWVAKLHNSEANNQEKATEHSGGGMKCDSINCS
jgi:hypothetical protein